jgi:hypothetical protein
MLLSWVHAWAAFVMPMAGSRPFPLIEGALILVLSALISLLHRGRGWRVIYLIALHGAGLLLAALRMVYVHFEWAHPFWSREWVLALLAGEHTFLERLLLLLVLSWPVGLWIGGTRIALKPVDRATLCSRFDLGTAFFLLLLFIRLILLGKGIPLNPVKNLQLGFLAFFVLGLLGLGWSRHEECPDKTYMAAYRSMGVVLSFMAFVLLFGGGLVMLFLPTLMQAAALGQGLLKAVAGPVAPIVIAVLRFVLVSGCHRVGQEAPASKSKDPGLDLPAAGPGEAGILDLILVWGD